MSDFLSLHSHSSASLLDGLGRVEEILRYAAETGNIGHCLTDHGNGTGLFPGWREAPKVAAEWGRPFRFVGGLEFYLVEDRMLPPPPRQRRATVGVSAEDEENTGTATQRAMPSRCHLTVLIQNEVGYRNMMALIAHANESGCAGGWGRYIPRIDFPLLEAHQEGLICLTGCVSGPISARILNGKMMAAEQYLRALRGVFGDRLYVEIMPTSYPDQQPANKGCLELAEEQRVPVVATNDVHWIRPEDADTHEVLCCIQTKSRMAETPKDEGGKRFRLSDRCYWLHNRAEMEADFQAYHGTYLTAPRFQRALDMSLEIAERVTFTGPRFAHEDPHLSASPERLQEFETWRAVHGVAQKTGMYRA